MSGSRPHLVLAAVVVLWAGSFAAIKHLLGSGLTGPEIAAIRYLIAAPGFLLAYRAAGGMPGIGRRDIGRILLAGLMVVAVYHIGLNEGERFTSSGTAAVIVATAPGMTLGLSLLLGLERFSAWRALGLAIAFAGVVVVVALGSGQEVSVDTVKGPLIVLFAPLGFALYNVIAKPLLARQGAMAVTSAASLCGTVLLLLIVPFSASADDLRSVSAWDAVLLLYLGLGCTLVGYILWTAGLARLDPSRTLAYLYGVPVLAVAIGAVLLDETVTGWLAVGAALVVGGLLLAQLGRRATAWGEPLRLLRGRAGR